MSKVIAAPVTLEDPVVVAAEGVTHLRYQVRGVADDVLGEAGGCSGGDR